jgi:hypothetical protein
VLGDRLQPAGIYPCWNDDWELQGAGLFIVPGSAVAKPLLLRLIVHLFPPELLQGLGFVNRIWYTYLLTYLLNVLVDLCHQSPLAGANLGFNRRLAFARFILATCLWHDYFGLQCKNGKRELFSSVEQSGKRILYRVLPGHRPWADSLHCPPSAAGDPNRCMLESLSNPVTVVFVKQRFIPSIITHSTYLFDGQPI